MPSSSRQRRSVSGSPRSQYDPTGKRYDLHPVVRGVAAGRMAANETVKLGQMVIDYFSRQPHDPWEQAETLEDVEPGLHIVRVLVRMGRYEEALFAYRGDLEEALFFNLGADAEVQALMRPFFPDGWDHEPVQLHGENLSSLLSCAALSLARDDPDQARKLHAQRIALAISRSDEWAVTTELHNLAETAFRTDRLAESERLLSIEARKRSNFALKIAS